MSVSKINCPYCWGENDNPDETSDIVCIAPAMGKLPTEKFQSRPKLYNLIFCNLMFWMTLVPSIGYKEKGIKCKHCGRIFYISVYDAKKINEIRNEKIADINLLAKIKRYFLLKKYGEFEYRLKTVKGEYPKTDEKKEKFLLEIIFDKLCHIFKLKEEYMSHLVLASFLFSLIFLGFPLAVLYLFHLFNQPEQCILHGFFGVILISVAIFFLKKYILEIRKNMDCENLPILVHENYKKTGYKTDYEMGLHGWIFGFPYRKIKSPTMMGIISTAVFLILLFQLNFISDIYLLWFWIITSFISGNILWVFLSTTQIVGLMGKYPLKEYQNPWKDKEMMNIFGKLLLHSLYPAGTIALLIFIELFYIYQISHPVLIFFVICYIAAITAGFFYPLWNIHKELKSRKEKFKNVILNTIKFDYISDSATDWQYWQKQEKEKIINESALVDLYLKIQTIGEWPFETDVFIKWIGTVFIPVGGTLLPIVIAYF